MKYAAQITAAILPVMMLIAAGCASPGGTVSNSSVNNANNLPAASAVTSDMPIATSSQSSTVANSPVLNAASGTTSSASAVNMQLRKAEGEVGVRDDKNKDVPVKQNIRLYSGYGVDTAKKSYAWIDLDKVKLAKLDADTQAVINKDGKKLEIEIKEGGLFFDIAKPLEDDESLYIRTSSLAIAIRGTVGWIDVKADNEAAVSLLQGKVEVTLEDIETGETEQASVIPGKTISCVIDENAAAGDKCEITTADIKTADIPGYVLVDVVADKELVQKIYDDTNGALDLRNITEEDAKKVLEKDGQQAPADGIQGRWRQPDDADGYYIDIAGNEVRRYSPDEGLYGTDTLVPNGNGYSLFLYGRYYDEEHSYELIDPNTLKYTFYEFDSETGERVSEITSAVYVRID